MTFAPYEFDRMQYLLGKSKHSPLTLPEENELRSYIAQEQPDAKNKPLEDLIALGLIIVGIYALYKILEGLDKESR
jgi:hypothetical protein